MLRRAGNSSITFDFKLEPALYVVSVDGARFEAALLNLIVNARQAAEPQEVPVAAPSEVGPPLGA